MDRPSFRAPLAVAPALALVMVAGAARAQLATPRPSPAATVSQTIGVTEVTVKYSRPGVKGRAIWGELVPYDKPWRTGANEATTFTTTHDVTFGGTTLKAGSYALLTIPTAKDWTVVISTDKDMWGAFGYKPEHDVLRVTATPRPAAEAEEWMRFSFEELTPSSADLVLRWEKLEVAVPITVDVDATFLASARSAIAAAKGDDWRTPFVAARWCFDNSKSLGEGAGWLDASIKAKETYANLGLKARWLAKDGKTADAIETGTKAIETGKASPDKPDVSALEKAVAEWSAQK
jgi:hypothetical protein